VEIRCILMQRIRLFCSLCRYVVPGLTGELVAAWYRCTSSHNTTSLELDG
jgi:hypothetical protein